MVCDELVSDLCLISLYFCFVYCYGEVCAAVLDMRMQSFGAQFFSFFSRKLIIFLRIKATASIIQSIIQSYNQSYNPTIIFHFTLNRCFSYPLLLFSHD